MANPIKGEVSFDADGKHYKFVLGTYALAALQRRTGVSTFKFFGRKPDEWGMDDILAVFHAGLLRHHELSEVEAADLVDTLGQEAVGKLIGEAVGLAFPPPTTGGASRPRKASGPGSNS